MAERLDLSKLSSEEKDALIVALLERIEELERRLGLNSSNSGKPPSSDGFKKPSRVNNQREKTSWKSGGQSGHEGTTLRQVATPDKVIDHCPSVCTGCGGALSGEPDSIRTLETHYAKYLPDADTGRERVETSIRESETLVQPWANTDQSRAALIPIQIKKPLNDQGLKGEAGDQGRTGDLVLGKHTL